jgi:GNAT superfamily N-acetyltransferase
MEDTFICRIATLEDMDRKWEYEIARHAEDPGNWIVWKKGALENRREGRTLPYYGILNGEIICEATAFIKPDPDEDSEGLIDETTAYLCAFRTNPPYRGKGYFSKLFVYMIEDLRARGYERVTVGVEPEEVVNKQIYAHYGFTEFVKTDTETYPDGTVIDVEYYAKEL